jgi:hypothetical protein
MNELFTFLSIIIVPIVASSCLYFYKSKCKSVRICYGLIEVERDVRGEEKSDITLDTNRTAIIESMESI